MYVLVQRHTIGVMEVVGQVETSVSNKRRRLDSGEPILLLQSSYSNDCLAIHCRFSVSNSPENTVSCQDPDQISLCLKNQPVKNSSASSDLKAENCGTDEISISICNGFSDGEMAEVMESSTTKKRKISQASSTDEAKMPSTKEIEEFFSLAEKYQEKRFAEKYNYDIVKDVPLEGRYQWVCLEP